MNDTTKYDEFCALMETKFPKMYKGKRYGGFAIGEGWWHIIESLSANIYHHVEHQRNMRLRDLRKVRAKRQGLEALITFHQGKAKVASDWHVENAEEDMQEEIQVTPRLNHINVAQIKEKFGGLRFYYDGGDEYISGLESMAESWAARTCETCGDRGERRHGGWVRTLCDKHEAEYQQRILERNAGNHNE